MKKKFWLLLILFLLTTFFACKVAFSGGRYWQYSEGRRPESEDVMKAKINTAIAIQKIAEEGITLRVIIEDRRL